MTPQELAAIREREAKATAGPWEWVGPDVPWSESTPIHTRGKKKGRPVRTVRDSYPIMLACPEGDGRIDWHDRGVFKVLWPSRKGEVIHTFKSKHDLGFIAHARADIPALLAALDAANAENERMRKALHRIGYEPIGPADASYVDVYHDIVKIARTALEPRP